MRLNIFAWALLHLLIFCVSPLLRAETVNLSLEKVEQFALKQNPMVLAAHAESGAAATKAIQAFIPNDPMIMFGAGGLDDSPFNIGSAATSTVMWDQRWSFPGKSLVDASAARSGARLGEAELADARRNALWHARRAYWEFRFNHEVHELRKKARKRWKFFDEALTSQGLSGQWLSVKRVKSQMGLAKAANEFITAGQAVDVAVAHLNHQLGMDVGTEYKLSDKEAVPAFKQKLEPLVEEAMQKHPLLAAAQARVDKAGKEKLRARMDFLPDLTTRLQATGPNGADKVDYGARVGISVPLGIRQGMVAKEKRLIEEAEQYRLQAMHHQVAHLVEEAYVNARSNWRLVDLYKKGGLLKQSNKAWDFAQGAWENEQISLDDFIQAYDAWLDIQVAWHRARADYGLALAQLDYMTGKLPQGDNHE